MSPDEDSYVRAYYEFPFNFKKKPERVAIVGAGSGNDVAAALRMGASHVDAIEIDPAIAFLGQNSIIPSIPMTIRASTLNINDARNFFRTAQQQYDLIIYGVLDSHTALSHASNLRVDSYVYTREGITEAFKLLKPDGVMSIAFALPNESLGFKLSHILKDIPGAGKPLAVRVGYDSKTTTAFITQKGRDVAMPDANAFAAHRLRAMSRSYFAQPYPDASIPTDDWPFFYMIARTYPVSYMIALGMVLVLSYHVRAQDHRLDRAGRAQLPAVLLPGLRLHAGGDQGHHRTRPASRRHLVRHRRHHRHGAADGVPRQPHGAAQARAANRARLSRLARQPADRLFHARNHDLVAFCFAAREPRWSACVLLTVPLFFSGFVFSTLIGKEGVNISTALAYNLMGALFGGLMEYNSMYFGFAFLYLLAMGFYGLAWVFSVSRQVSPRRLAAAARDPDSGFSSQLRTTKSPGHAGAFSFQRA